MSRTSCRTIFAIGVFLAICLASAAVADINWSIITSPVNDGAGAYNHIGTDGTSLYVVFGNQQFWKYTFNADNPTAGTWNRLADPPRNVCDWDSYSDMAYQNGYLYTSAVANNGGRTILRYNISANTWSIWQQGGSDLNICYTSGNAIIMDPSTEGVGYSAWHAGFWWVKFDWNAKSADNNWFSTSGLGVLDSGWISRNEDITTDGAGTYYATKNDQTAGLSGGDVIYKWTGMAKGTTPSVLVQKPWQAGFGQSIEFIPGTKSPSGHNELWIVRGSDANDSAGEGWGQPTSNWARIDLSNISGGWIASSLPGTVGYNGEITYVNGSVFVRGTSDKWYVTKLSGATTPNYISISAAKELPDSTPAIVQGTASADFTTDIVPKFYIQSSGRASGIQVRYAVAPSIGQKVIVTGVMRTDSTTKERYIEASNWINDSGVEAVKPLAMNSRVIGGGSMALQEGVYQGYGLNNVGLLVKYSGKVTGKATDNSYVYLSDGSGISDGGLYEGVRVDLSAIPSTNRPTLLIGDFVEAVGISSMYQMGGQSHRMVRVRSASDIQNISDDGNRPRVFKVMVINFDPIVEIRGNKRLHQVYGWNDPYTLAQLYINDLKECSGGWADYQIVEWVDQDVYPIKIDGFQYTDASYTYAWEHGGPFHSPDGVDYVKVVQDKYYSYNNPKTVVERVAAGEIDEVLLFGAPYFGYYESQMIGPTAYWCNSPGIYLASALRNFIVMGFNYERGVGEMLEDYGHRTESIMWHVYGSWHSYPPQHNWDKFTLIDKNITNHNLYTAGCGNVHYAPNSQSDYDWGNSTYVWSTCDDWLYNWPNLTGTKKLVNCVEWGGGDMRLHHRWWFMHIPNKPGINPDGKQNNWWKYLADHWSYPESR